MVANWMCMLILLGLTCGKVLENSRKTERGRHTMKQVSRRDTPTKGNVAKVEKVVPSEADVCKAIKCGFGKKCELTAGGEATCVCIQDCGKGRTRLLCASDGVTYTNECEMQRAACRDGLQLSMEHEGMCAPPPTDPTISTQSPRLRKHPIACYRDQRDALHQEVVEWLQGVEAPGRPGARPYETVLRDCFTRFDDTEDGFLEPAEFLRFVEHNETLRRATDDLNQDLEEDTLLRDLCVDALLAEADENFDWRLSLAEFTAVMMPGFSPPIKMCSLEGEYFTDGEEKKNKCNVCICACGNWVCTANACDGSMIAGETVEDKLTDKEAVSKDTWTEILKKLSSLAPDKFPTRSQNLSQLAADVMGAGDETAVDSPPDSGKDGVSPVQPLETSLPALSGKFPKMRRHL